ncbi:MAG: alkaline phosphatase D family protein [Rhodothalassiaceae bacterium]
MISALTRRQMIGSMGAAAGAAALMGRGAVAQEAGHAGFLHGVACGDPLADRLVIWTRFTPADDKGPVGVDWEVAEEQSFGAILHRGRFETDAARDFTVKIDVAGLAPGRDYYYRFRHGEMLSPVGHGRTLPLGAVERLRFAVVSCSNWPQGFFNVYRSIAGEDFDAVLHLGDYLYEYPDGVYADPAALEQGRHVLPAHEMVTLADYRQRHALYKTDPDLQALHAAHAMIAIWDDHEFANDTWKGGAQNHNEGEGDYFVRRDGALRAYYEWMPVRESASPLERWRRFDFGDLAQLILMETRTTGRDRQLSYAEDMIYRSVPFDFSDPENPVAVTDPERLKALPADKLRHLAVPFDMRGERPVPVLDYATLKAIDPKALPEGHAYLPDAEAFRRRHLEDPARRMISETQERFIADALAGSKAPFRLIAQQLLMGRLVAPPLMDVADFSKPSVLSREQAARFQMLADMGLPLNLDSWDGYDAARERMFDLFSTVDQSVIVLAGDSHNSWAFDLEDKAGRPVGVELATPGVSSPGFDRYLPVPRDVMAERFLARNPLLRHFEPGTRGFIDLVITREAATARWRHVSTVLSRDYQEIAGAAFRIGAGDKRLTPLS